MIGIEFFQKVYSSESKLIIFDVGAHHGNSVDEFISLFPMSRVFAFEPDKENFSILKNKFKNEHRVEVFNVAVGQKDGRVLLHRNNYDATHSLLRFDVQEGNRWSDSNDFQEVEAIEVEQISLETFCRKRGLDNINILKLDIQGGEMMAFQGVKEKLASQAIDCIFCEVEFRQLYERQPLFWDITSLLRSYSYHFINIVSPKVSEMGVLSWADAVYVKDELWNQVALKHSAGKLLKKTDFIEQNWSEEVQSELNIKLGWLAPGSEAKMSLSRTATVVTPPRAWSYGALALISFPENFSGRRGIARVLLTVAGAKAGIGFTGDNHSNFIKRVEVLPANQPQEIYFEFDYLSELKKFVIQTWDEDKSAEVELLEFSIRNAPYSEHLIE